MNSGAGPQFRPPPERQLRERTFLGYPWWWLGVDARSHRGWWMLAVVALPVTCWSIAIACIPYGESINEMRPTQSAIAVAAGPPIAYLASLGHPQRLAFVRANVVAVIALGVALLCLAVIGWLAFLAFVIFSFATSA